MLKIITKDLTKRSFVSAARVQAEPIMNLEQDHSHEFSGISIVWWIEPMSKSPYQTFPFRSIFG